MPRMAKLSSNFVKSWLLALGRVVIQAFKGMDIAFSHVSAQS